MIAGRVTNPESAPEAAAMPRPVDPMSGLPGAISRAALPDSWPRALAYRWWIYLALVDAVLVLVTFYVGGGYPKEFFLRPLALSTEQGVGTWWSGLQFLLFALLAQSLAIDLQRAAPRTSRGFTLLALIGLLLLVDELGSVHERVHSFVPLPGELALLPLALVGAALLATSLALLIQRRDIVGRAPRMIVGAFFLFGCVSVLEFVEQHLTWDLALWRGFRFALEEGLELVGAMLLIASAVHVGRTMHRGTRPGLGVLMPSSQALHWLFRICVCGAIPLWLLRAAFTADQLALPLRGDFGLLIPIAAFMVAALFALQRGLAQPSHRTAWWSLAAALLVASLDLECHFHHYLLYGDADLRWRSDLGLLWSTPLLGAVMVAIPALRSRTALVGLAVCYAVVVTSVILDVAPLALAAPYAVALLMVHLVGPRHVTGDATSRSWPEKPVPAI